MKINGFIYDTVCHTVPGCMADGDSYDYKIFTVGFHRDFRSFFVTKFHAVE